MITQWNQLKAYLIPRSGRFLAALCAGFSVQRRNQMLLSAVLLLSVFAMMSDAFAQSKPGRVGNLTAIPAGNGQIVLNWTAPNDGGSPITGYKFISRGPHGDASRGLPINPTGYIASGLTNGSRYEFFIIAANRVGDSPNVRITATPSATAPVATAPATPTNLTAVAGDRQITLNWDASDGRLPLLGYDLIIIPTAGRQVNLSTLPSGTDTRFTVPNLTNGVSHRFFLTARNVVGKSPSARVVVTPRPPTAPGPVTNLTAVAAGDGQVTLSWTAPVDNGRSPLTDYGLEITLPNGTAFTPPTLPSGTDTTHTVSNLTNGTEYRFSLSARNVVGGSQAVSVTATPATTPAAVTDLTAAPGDGQVTLSWDAPDDGGSPLTGYGLSVFRADDLENRLTLSTPPPTATATTYTVSGLTNKVAYNFRLTATNVFGLGADAQITANPATVPGLVINPIAEPGDEQITLSWTAPDDGGSPLTSYSVVIILPDGTTLRPPTLPGSATTYTATELTNGTKYTFSIAARNAVGNGSGRQDVSATPRVLTPAAVTDLTAVAGDGQVTLSWTAPADDGGLPLTSYRLSIAPAEGAAVEPSIQPSANATTHTVSTGLSNGTVYEFHLRATNAEGDGPSVIVTATPSAIPTAPGRVTKLTAVAGDEQVTLSWVAPADDGRSPLTGYSLLISDASDEITPLTTATTHTVTGLTNGTSYTFNIAAKNAVGQSSFAGVTVTPAITTPAAATKLTAVAGDGQVTLNWIAPDDGGSEILDYEIQTVVIVGAESFSDPPLTVSSGSATTYTVPSLVNGNRHDFSLIARNAVGPGTAATVSATPLALTAPAAVTGLTATAGNEYVILSWTAPVDNGVPVADYELQRTLIVEGVPNPLPLVIVPLSSLTVVNGVTTYKALGLTNGDVHTFSLAARNADGIKGAAEMITATPTAPAQSAPSQITDLSATAGVRTITLTWTVPDLNGGTFILYDIFYEDGDANETITDYSTTSRTLTFPNVVPQTFTIRTQNSVGTSAQSNEVTISALAPAQSAPSQITDLSATVGVGTVTLTWTAPVDDGGSSITDYKLRIVDSDGTEIAPLTALNSTATTHTVSTGLSNGTAYEFQVRATNAVGDGPSVSASATLTTRPGRVTNLTAVAGDGQVTLSWTAPDDGGSPLTGYGFRVNRSAGGALGGLPSPGADATTITIDRKLSNGTEYIFFIFARNIVGDSLQETSVTATPRAPTAPQAVTGLTAVASGTTVTLNWTAPVNDGGSAITNYKLRIVDSNGTEIAPLTPLNTTATTHTVTTGLSNGTTYEFHVRATNAEGDSGTAFASATIPATAPAAITDLTAVASGDGTITLSWTPPDNGGSDLLNYSLLIAPAGGVVFEPSIQPFADATTHTATNLTNGTAYEFSLTAKNAIGDAPTASVSATPAAVPERVTGLTAVAGDRQVTLSWTAPVNNGGSSITDYKLEILDSNGAEIAPLTALNSIETTYTVNTGLSNGTAYEFQVRATNAVGDSPAVSASATPVAAPQAVTGLTAVAGDETVTLNWTAPVNDGGSSITDYKLRIVDSNGTEIAPLTALNSTATTQSVSTGLSNGTAYEFEVRATNAVGDSAAVSASATPVAAPQAVTGLTAAPGDRQVTLSWTAPVNNGGSPLTNYKLRIVDSNGTEIAPLTALNSTATTQSVNTGLSNGTAYEFEVRATNAVGDSPAVSASATPVAAPQAVTTLTAVAGDETVTLNWTAPDNGGSDLLNYSLLIAPAGGVVFEPSIQPFADATTHTATNLTNGTAYEFSLTAKNAIGDAPTASVSATPAAVPERVTGLTAVAGDRQVTLSWTAPVNNGGSSITDYKLEILDSNGAEIAPLTALNSIETTYTVNTGLSNGTAYEFHLRATNAVGDSPAVSASATPVAAPQAVTGLTAVAGDETVTLNWTAPVNDGGSPITNYKLRIVDSDGAEIAPLTALNSTATTQSVSTGLSNGTAYEFEVRATNAVGDSAAVSASATPVAAPQAVTGLTAAPGDGQVTLSWTAPVDDGGSPLTDYTLEIFDDDDNEYDVLPTQPSGTVNTHTVTGLPNGTLLTFFLTARNATGDAPRAFVSATPVAAPQAVTTLTAVAGDETVTLNWTAPVNDGGSPITNYKLRIVDSDGAEIAPLTALNSTATTQSVSTGLSNGTAYEFQVRATNAVGDGPAASVTATPATVPQAVTTLTAVAGDGQVTLSWTAPVDDGGSPLIDYKLQVYNVDNDTLLAQSTQPSGTAITHTVTGLTNGVEYSFTLTARNAVGETPTPPVVFVNATPAVSATVPAAITNLTAVASDRQVTLNWTAPVNDKGSGITDYKLQIVDSNGTEIAPLTALNSTVTTHTVTTGLSNGTQYEFRVRATNGVGDGPSATVTATPAATVPEAVTGLTAVASGTTVTLNWTAPVNNGGSPITDYKLRIVDSAGAEIAPLTALNSTATTQSVSTGLSKGTEYEFQVRATNAVGDSPSANASATPPVTVPGAVTGLRTVVFHQRVTLHWTAPTNGGLTLNNYKLQIVDSEGTPFNPPELTQPSGTVTSHRIDSMNPGTLYTFSLTANNDVGDSPTAEVDATPVTFSGLVNDLTVISVGDGEVTLSWTAPDSDGGSPLTGYKVTITTPGSLLRSTTVDADTGIIRYVSPSDAVLANGTEYQFEISTRNAVHRSSTTANIKATPRSPITKLKAEAGDGEVTLSWTAPVNNGGSAILDYKLRVAPIEATEHPLVTVALSSLTVVNGVTSYPVPDLSNDTEYRFYLAARYKEALGIEEDVSATPVVPPATAPQAVIGLAAAVNGDNGQITLSWMAPANGGSDINAYKLRIVESGAGAAEILSLTALSGIDVTSMDFTYPVPTNLLTIGTAYEFHLRATNAVGDSPSVSATATPVEDSTEPGRVTNLTAVAGDETVTLNWTAPVNNGGSSITDYKLRIVDSDGTEIAPLTALNSTATTQSVSTGLSNGTAYEFQVRATNAVGDSPAVSATATPATVPNPVTGLTALAGDSRVTLSWIAPTDNGGSPITGYILRITGGDGVFEPLTLSKVVAPHTDSRVINGTSYTFTLVAVNAVGQSSLPPGPALTATPRVPVTPDTTPPVISLVDDNVSLVRGSTYTEADARAGVTALDDRDGVIARSKIIIDITGVDTTTVGTYRVTYNVADIADNDAATVIGMVTITAPTKPAQIVLTATAGDGKVTLSWTAPDNGGSAIDEYNLLVVENGINGETIAPGGGTIAPTPTPIQTYIVDNLTNGTSYTFTLTARNPQGDSPPAIETRTPVGPDTTLPVISPNDPATVSLERGYPYSDDGDVTATDNIDGVITSAIDIDLTELNINAVGTYTITYTVMDKAGNKSAPVTRMVMVTADMTPPVISPNEPATVSLEVGGSYTKADAGAGVTATDNIDGDITSAIEIDITDVKVNVVGTYTVTYNVEDDGDNDAIERTRTVIVTADMTLPVIMLNGPDTIILERGSTYTKVEAGAGVTATDNIDGDISGDIDIDITNVNVNVVGTYRVTYNVVDSTDNPAAEVIRTVTIASPIPSANAGVDQLVVPGADVILSGSGTDVKDDAAGTALRYVWTLTSGTLAPPGLSDENTATARFTAATVVTSTVIYVFTLTVTDSDDNSGTDTVTISVTSEVVITKDIDKQNKVVLPSMGRAIAYQNINAISTRISQVGGATRKNSLGGNTNVVDILKSIERLNKDSSLSAKEALGNSRFAVALDGIGAALWGKIDYQKFKGTDQNVKYDGSLFSSTLGVEGQINNRARLGLALSHTKSDIDYTDSAPIISATSGGDYEIVMLSVNPYISWKPSDDVDLWATLGYGQGDLELILADSDRLRSSDLRQKTAAVGGSGVVFDNGAIELRLKGEALKTRFEVDKSEGIAALALDAARLRVGLEGSHALSLENGASLNSSVELGVRYDSGDGQTGSRGEVGGRLEYSNGRGLTLEGNARVLVGGGNYDEWGLGGLLKFQPSTDGRGISFNLGLGQGSTVSKTEDIWKNALTNKSKSTATHSTTSIKLGYGITAPYWIGGSAYGILTPYTEVKLGNSNSYDLGLDWRIDPSVGFKLNLKNRKKSVNSINLEGEIRF